jgi:hypothetical protein
LEDGPDERARAATSISIKLGFEFTKVGRGLENRGRGEKGNLMRPLANCKNIVLFVTAHPSLHLLQFAGTISQLDNSLTVRVISDQPFHEHTSFPLVLHVSDDEVVQAGFYNACPPRVCRYRDQNYDPDRQVSAWDKALYHLHKVDLKYDFAWICEDDVYFRSAPVFGSILSEYQGSEADLICRQIATQQQHPNWIHWPVNGRFFRPEHVQRGFVPFCRLSRTLLQEISQFANRHKQLTYIEVLFASLCKARCLNAVEFDEKLRLIMYRPVRTLVEANQIFSNISEVQAIHPVKEITEIPSVSADNGLIAASQAKPLEASVTEEVGGLEANQIEPKPAFDRSKVVLDLQNKVESKPRCFEARHQETEVLRKRVFELQGALNATLAEHHAIYASTSWRLTLPIRRFAERFPWLASRLKQVLQFCTFQLALRKQSGLRTDRVLQLLKSSQLFDGQWYLAQYLDVGLANADPAVHYLEHGALEGRDPSPLFDSNWYLEQNQDVKVAGFNPLVHYLQYGAVEGRRSRPRGKLDLQALFTAALPNGAGSVV